jgi:hypothetical protein
MKHKHHVIPKHMGGSDDPSNIVELTVDEHAEAHLKLYEKYGKHEDLCAYYMLSGNIEKFRKVYSKLGGTASQKKRQQQGLSGSELFYGRKVTYEEKFKNSSKGGKIQGPINSENGHMKSIQKLSDCSAAGKKGGNRTIKLQKGTFGNPEERKKVASLGGKVQGKINGENGHCKKISQEYWQKVRNGELKRDKKIWITNDKENKMILCGEKIYDGWRKGKTQAKKI